MPNYVGNILKINANEKWVKEVIDFVKNDDENMVIDFDKIIPMPKELHIAESSVGDYGLAVIKKQNHEEMTCLEESMANMFKTLLPKMKTEAMELGQKYYDNLKKYGSKTWLDWSRANWGTKWNAMETKLMGDNIIYFETAWNGVEPLIKALSEKFTDVMFEYIYADEDTGYNCARGTICNGDVEMFYPDFGSVEAYEISFEVRPYLEDDYEFVDGEYRYVEAD